MPLRLRGPPRSLPVARAPCPDAAIGTGSIMTLLAIQEPGAALTVRDGALVVMRDHKTLRTLPPHDLDEVHLYGAIELTAAARNFLLDKGLDTLFFTADGRYRGRLLAAESRAGERRARQYRRLLDEDFALRLARRFVHAKLRNQRTVLQRLQRERATPTIAAGAVAMRALLARLDAASDLDTLRGLEGQAAVLYFRGYGAALTNPDFAFAARNRRPPRDPVNACLSFGYTLLLTRVESALRRAGLDPHFGALHSPGRAKPALALDMMEELRPIVVDRLVLRLVNRRQLTPDDFGPPRAGGGEEGAVHLAGSGRAIFLREYGQTLRTRHQHGPRNASHTLAAVIDRQAELLASALESDPPYAPFLLR